MYKIVNIDFTLRCFPSSVFVLTTCMQEYCQNIIDFKLNVSTVDPGTQI